MKKFVLNMRNRFQNTNINNKVIALNTIGAFVIKGATLIISLLTMPGYLNYFDSQLILGTWFALVSVLTWILTFDLGIGNGLRNHLVPAIVSDDSDKIKKYISSAYIIVSIVVCTIVIPSVFLFKYIDWNTIFNLSVNVVSNETLAITVTIVFVGIMLQFIFKLITSILFAMQKSALTNLLSLISSIIIFLFVSFVKFQELSSSLIFMAVAHSLAINIPLIIATATIFRKNLKGLRPSFKDFNWKYAQDIVKLGGIFFWVQITFMLITATNDYLIAIFTAPDQVVEYQIYNRLFTLIGMLFLLALTPIWSAVTKAIAEEDFTWVLKLYRTLKIMALIASVLQFLMIPFLQFGIDLWLGEDRIQVNYFYAITFAIFGSMLIWNGVLASIANGCNQLKGQSIFFTIGVIVKVPAAIFFVEIYQSWIGIIAANIVALALYSIVQPIWLDKYLGERQIEREQLKGRIIN